MEAIKILIVIFGILFLLEKKPMNIIFNFLGIIITTAILLAQNNTDYLAYLLIIIYCSALTIIFGFVIMLTGDFNQDLPQNNNKLIGLNNKLLQFFILFILIIIFYLFKNNILSFFNFEYLSILSEFDNTFIEYYSDNIIMKKIGNLLYIETLNIMKLFISTLILLLALIALFYTLLLTI